MAQGQGQTNTTVCKSPPSLRYGPARQWTRQVSTHWSFLEVATRPLQRCSVRSGPRSYNLDTWPDVLGQVAEGLVRVLRADAAAAGGSAGTSHTTAPKPAQMPASNDGAERSRRKGRSHPPHRSAHMPRATASARIRATHQPRTRRDTAGPQHSSSCRPSGACEHQGMNTTRAAADTSAPVLLAI